MKLLEIKFEHMAHVLKIFALLSGFYENQKLYVVSTLGFFIQILPLFRNYLHGHQGKNQAGIEPCSKINKTYIKLLKNYDICCETAHA